MTKIAELRKQAKQAGIPASKIRGASSEELQDMLSNGNKPRKKVRAAVRKAVTRKRGAVRRTATRTDRPKARGSKTAPAAKSAQGKAKRPSTATRSTRKRTTNQNGDSGRFLLDGVDYNHTDGWNARPGSPPDRIIKLLKSKRGNRERVFDALKGDVWEFVGKVKRNGQKRTKTEALEMLRYRISRTAWEFAMRTNQHQSSDNRVEYGKGGTGEGIWKPAGKRAAQKRSTAKRSTTKRGASPKRATAQKRSQARKRTTAKRGTAKRRTAKR